MYRDIDERKYLSSVKRGLTLQLLKQVVLVEKYICLKHKQHMCHEILHSDLTDLDIAGLSEKVRDGFVEKGLLEDGEVIGIKNSKEGVVDMNADSIHEMLMCSREMRKWGLEPEHFDSVYTFMLDIAERYEDGAIAELLRRCFFVQKLTYVFGMHILSDDKELTKKLYSGFLENSRNNPFINNDNLEMLCRSSFVLICKLLDVYFDEKAFNRNDKTAHLLLQSFMKSYIIKQ